jgi:lysophospholipase L1-like esterase
MFRKNELSATILRVLPLLVITFLLACSPLKKYTDSVQKWENDIREFEQLDSTNRYPNNAVLFMGSSSIRLWNTLEEDIKPYSVIQRGFGGSRISDVAWYTPRIVYPHQIQAVVIFVANDISGSKEDKTPQEIASLFSYIVKTIHKKHPDLPVFYIQVTPTESRWKVWPRIQEGNKLVKQLCAKNPDLHFVETAKYFLSSEGTPNAELFVDDKLHLSAQGYQIWTRLVKAELDKVLKK